MAVKFIVVGRKQTGGGAGPPLGGRVWADGRFWYNELGVYRPCYVSGFLLSALMVRDRPKAIRYLDFAQGVGFNGIRVFLGALEWGPQTVEEARAGFGPLCVEAARRQLTIEATALTDSATGYDIHDHLSAIGHLCGSHTNTLPEVANEPYHSTQASPVHDFGNLSSWGQQYFSGTAWACGAPDTDEPNPEDEPIDGGWISIHLDRSRDEWNMVRRVRELEAVSNNYGAPVMNNEPIGWAEVAEPGRRCANPSIAFTMGVLSRGFEVGVVSHADHALMCDMPGPVQIECHVNEIAGFRVFRTEAKLVYKNTGWVDSPVASADFNNVVRVYSFMDSPSHGWSVPLGITGDPQIHWQNGFAPVQVVAERPQVQVIEISK